MHRRSLWQVLAIYVGAAWIAYEAVQGLTEGLGLPEWFPGFAVVLFIAGLPIVLATAFVQEGGPVSSRSEKKRPAAAEAAVEPEAAAAPVEPETAVVAGEPEGVRRLLRWRNVLVVGVLIFAVWGVVSAGWILMAVPGLAVRAEAADFFSAHDFVVVAEFDNQTDQEALSLAVRSAIVTDLEQSEYVAVINRTELGEVLGRMQLPDTARIGVDEALDIARREGYPAVVSGEVAQLGSGYQLTVSIIEVATGDVAVRVRETAADDADVIPTVERLSRLTRRHLGESLPSIRRSQPLPKVTTASLEALQHYARAVEFGTRGDYDAAITTLQEAVKLDSTFAAAYRALAIYHGNIGEVADAKINIDKAYQHSERLLDRERYYTGASYHAYRGYRDSAAFYYRLVLDRDPNMGGAVNNLGDIYERLGRYEDALKLYRRAVDLSPGIASHINLASAARTLGDHELADSALGLMRERFPQNLQTFVTSLSNALYAGDFESVEALGLQVTDNPYPWPRIHGALYRSNVHAVRGQIGSALALADSAAALTAEAGSPFFQYQIMRIAYLSALAAGYPERALPFVENIADPSLLGASPLFQHLALAGIAQGYALAGAMTEARRLLASADSLEALGDFRPSGVAEQVRAIIALQEGRPEDSLDHLNKARALDYGLLYRPAHLLLGDAYAALGRLDDAVVYYDSLTSTYRMNFIDFGTYAPLLPVAHERLGSVYLQLGDTASAVKHLAAFTELWQDADEELQPRVESAQRTLARLAGEGN
ncbi:MAG: tetratricopeptide repeat protein, partial [Gemmatimonadota bacterium]